jgi:hypothetical protein
METCQERIRSVPKVLDVFFSHWGAIFWFASYFLITLFLGLCDPHSIGMMIHVGRYMK